MLSVNDYREERSCVYQNEEYLVRDNGAVLRKTPPQKRARKLDNQWTFGNLNIRSGYFEIASVRIHRIVAVAFHGEPPTKWHVVDHIDTNRLNNRPSNLRWVTRLENAVLNEITRQRIEYRTGVSVYEFLENPSKYRDALEGTDFSWMRQVTEDEAKMCLENLKEWAHSESKLTQQQTSKIGDWVYQNRAIERSDDCVKELQTLRAGSHVRVHLTDSITRTAKQKDWKTPAQFLCCPEEVKGDPIQEYIRNISEGATFSVDRNGESKVVKFASVGDESIFVMTAITSGIKPFALAKITYENGYYIHSSMGTFFQRKGAEKHFMLAQGLEWTGGDTIDDFY